MKRSSTVVIAVSAVLLAGLALGLCGCYGIPKGTMKNAKVGEATLQATGAGIVSADAQKTTFRIKCAVCGYEPLPITIDTPVAGKPYTLDWVCPKCGHKQKIVIQVGGS
jgi:hypothetical protein